MSRLYPTGRNRVLFKTIIIDIFIYLVKVIIFRAMIFKRECNVGNEPFSFRWRDWRMDTDAWYPTNITVRGVSKANPVILIVFQAECLVSNMQITFIFYFFLKKMLNA